MVVVTESAAAPHIAVPHCHSPPPPPPQSSTSPSSSSSSPSPDSFPRRAEFAVDPAAIAATARVEPDTPLAVAAAAALPLPTGSYTAAVLDVAAVDAYLLATYVAPPIVALWSPLVAAAAEYVPHHRHSTVRRRLLAPCDWQRQLLPLLLQLVTLLATRGQTPAVRLLGLQLEPTTAAGSRAAAGNLASPPPSSRLLRARLLAYAVLSLVGPAVSAALVGAPSHDWLAARRQRLTALRQRLQPQQQQSNNNNDNNHSGSNINIGSTSTDATASIITTNGAAGATSNAPGATQQQQQERRLLLALERQCRVGDAVAHAVQRVGPVLRLAALLACWSGVSHTPDPAMILTGLTYRARQHAPAPNHQHHPCASPSLPPRLHVTYAHRRWLALHGWATVHLLLGAGWTLAARAWTPPVRDAVDAVSSLLWRMQRQCTGRLDTVAAAAGESAAMATTNAKKAPVCTICRRVPRTSAVRADCGHISCYACLYLQQQQRQSASARIIRCRMCGRAITTATAVLVHTATAA